MSLFSWGNFALSAGAKSPFEIDCDHLSDGEIVVMAELVSRLAGGERLAMALNRKHRLEGAVSLLLVDDVLATGESMEKLKALFAPHVSVKGAVLFARGECPDWVSPVFSLNKECFR